MARRGRAVPVQERPRRAPASTRAPSAFFWSGVGRANRRYHGRGAPGAHGRATGRAPDRRRRRLGGRRRAWASRRRRAGPRQTRAGARGRRRRQRPCSWRPRTPRATPPSASLHDFAARLHGSGPHFRAPRRCFFGAAGSTAARRPLPCARRAADTTHTARAAAGTAPRAPARRPSAGKDGIAGAGRASSEGGGGRREPLLAAVPGARRPGAPREGAAYVGRAARGRNRAVHARTAAEERVAGLFFVRVTIRLLPANQWAGQGAISD